MVNKSLVLGALVLLILPDLGGSSPVDKVPVRLLQVEPGRSLHESVLFRGSERANVVIVAQDASSLLALYVFDEHGNCMAWDDKGGASTKTVDWLPTQTTRYDLEVRNLGATLTRFQLVVR